MTEKAQKPIKNRQKNSISGCDQSDQRPQPDSVSDKNTCDHAETAENTGLSVTFDNQKNNLFHNAGPQPDAADLSIKEVSELLGVSVQAVRDNAANGKYPGAHKTKINGVEVWAIPLAALPAEAQALHYHKQITARGLSADLFPGGSSYTPEEREEHWKRYDLATPKCQGRARDSFAALKSFEAWQRKGTKKMECYGMLAAEYGVARSTFNEWQKAVDGLAQGDWLPALVPDFSGRTNARRSDWPGQSWLHFLDGALTPGRPLATAYKHTEREADKWGWGKLPSLQTARRDYGQIDDAVKTLIKQGPTALKRLSPTVERDYTSYALHEMWSMDGRRIDLMVRDTKGEFGPKGKVFRLYIYAIEEARSRYLVGYAMGSSLNADLVRDAAVIALTNTKLIRPDRIQVDNGMESAAKEITGGAPYRLRGKVKEDEIIGFFPFIGTEVYFTTTAHGQTKGVERMFGTLARMCETRPEFRGAYCGNSPEARPEEWDASKAVPIELVRELLTEEVAAYHRTPHRGHGMDGKSPMAVYTELMNAPGYVPKQISQRQFRRCVLSAIPITIQDNGQFIIHGARYYSEQTARLPKGRGYYACYNRHDLSEPVYVYRANKLVAEDVPQIKRTPGNCKESAKKIMKARSDFIKSTRAAAKALLTAQEIDTPQEIIRAALAKHPGILDKETGEILPVAPVVQIIQPAAEVPKNSPPKSVEQKAQAKKLATEFDSLLYPSRKQRY